MVVGSFVGQDGVLYFTEPDSPFGNYSFHALGPEGSYKWTMTGKVAGDELMGSNEILYAMVMDYTMDLGPLVRNWNLSAIDPAGDILWSVPVDSLGSPLLAQGSDGELLITTDYYVSAVKSSDGSVLWLSTYYYPSGQVGTTIKNGNLFRKVDHYGLNSTTNIGGLSVYEFNRTLKWKYPHEPSTDILKIT